MANPNGRPIGSPNKQSRALQTLVDERGNLSPGRVMLETMWVYYGLAAEIQRDVARATSAAGKAEIAELLKAACGFAKDVAPYVHTRLSSVIVAGDHDGGAVRHHVTGGVGLVALSAADFAKLSAGELAQIYRETIGETTVLGDEPEPSGARAGDVQTG